MIDWQTAPASGLEAADHISALEAELERRKADGDHTCSETCPRTACVLRRRVAELEGALQPFALAAEIRLCADEGYWTNDQSIQGTDVSFHITFGDLRRALSTLNADRSEK